MRTSRLTLGLGTAAAAVLIGCVTAAQDPPPDFRFALPAEMQWTAHPIVPGAELAVLLGNPAQPEPAVVRMRFPAEVRIMPHTHPEARTYTVLTGEWKLGFGVRFDPDRMLSFPAGSVYRLPAGVPHWQATGVEGATIQIESVGPSRTDFLDPADDPRRR